MESRGSTWTIRLRMIVGIAVLLAVSSSVASQGSNDHVYRIGNDMRPSVSGVDVAGAIFLINDQVLTEGTVFAFSAYFRHTTPMRFQIWRPLSNSTDEKEYMLINEYAARATQKLAREDHYVRLFGDDRLCTRVQNGDRIGVYMEEAPTAVAYVFDSSDPTALGYKVLNISSPVFKGENITFDALVFPYDFSVSAYLYQDLNPPSENISASDVAAALVLAPPERSLVPCPIVQIPERFTGTLPPTAATVPPTGQPGATGETGPRGNRGGTGATGPTGPLGGTGPAGRVGATGRRGLPGDAGTDGGEGATGADGLIGATGVEGPAGTKGDKGANGLPGLSGKDGIMRVNSTGLAPAPVVGVGSDKWMVIGLLIWLGIVTLFLLILIIVVCCLCCARDKDKKERGYEKRYADSNDYDSPSYANDAFHGSNATLEAQKARQKSLYVSPGQQGENNNRQGGPRTSTSSRSGDVNGDVGVVAPSSAGYNTGGRAGTSAGSPPPSAGYNTAERSNLRNNDGNDIRSSRENIMSLYPPSPNTPTSPLSAQNYHHNNNDGGSFPFSVEGEGEGATYQNTGGRAGYPSASGNGVVAAAGEPAKGDWIGSLREDEFLDITGETATTHAATEPAYQNSLPRSPASPVTRAELMNF